MLVGRADPIDRLPVLVATTIDLNRYHSHRLLEQQVGYPADPMAILPVEVVPMDQAKKVRPTVAVPQYLLHLACSRQQAVAEQGFVRPTLRPVVVEQGFAHPMGRVVAERAFGYSTQQAVAEMGFESPTLQPVVVDLVGSKNLHLAYYLVGSILVGELVAPDVANLKMPRHLPFSFSRYCGRASALLPE